MKFPIYKPGDIVQVKDLEELISEYGVNGDISLGGYVKTPVYVFAPGMTHLCGQVFQIRSVTVVSTTRDDNFCFFRSEENIELRSDNGLHWKISSAMIKPYDKGPRSEIDLDEWMSVLCP